MKILTILQKYPTPFFSKVLHITATNKYDAEVKFSHKFTEECLRKMGLTNKDSMNKIERLLSQARDGDSEDSRLLFFMPGHNLPPAFDVNTSFSFFKVFIYYPSVLWLRHRGSLLIQ